MAAATILHSILYTDNSKAFDLIYLYFQKAYDKVPHETLMVNANAHGIQGDAARWIPNWLAGRRQLVCINQSYSNWALVTSGVPQVVYKASYYFLYILYIYIYVSLKIIPYLLLIKTLCAFSNFFILFFISVVSINKMCPKFN